VTEGAGASLPVVPEPLKCMLYDVDWTTLLAYLSRT
jgi:hypothetical protein